MDIPRRRHRVLSTVLALALAIESVSAVAAAARVSSGSPDTSDGPNPGAAQPAVQVAAMHTVSGVASDLERELADLRTVHQRLSVGPATPEVAPASPERTRSRTAASERSRDRDERARPKHRQSREKPRHSTRDERSGGDAPRVRSYVGRNHVWMPSLGINRPVAWFACSRSREPDNLVYRWGCAGSNNVYLLGHAWGVFDPLHDAYVRGRLRTGMRAWYADANGRVRVYAVRWWKVVKPTAAASWAWAPQSRPSMTLQTCVGSRSQYRLMVRLTQVDG